MIKSLILSLSLIGSSLISGFIPQNNSFNGLNKESLERDSVQTNVRFSNPQRVLSSSENNIEQNNVSYDLKYYFGKKTLGDNYRNFNLDSLIPTKGDTKDDNFKFLLAKPVGDNLYFYVWSLDYSRCDFTNGTIQLADLTSKLPSDNSLPIGTYGARFVNSCGVDSRFSKWSVDGLCKSGDFFNFIVADCFLGTTNKSSYIRPCDKGQGNLRIGDEFSFSPSDNSDFSSSYFKDDYVKITDHDVKMLLVSKDKVVTPSLNVDMYFSANEDTYYFFNCNRNIDDLLEVQYEYYLDTYQAKYKFGNPGEWTCISDKENGQVYPGMENGSITGKLTDWCHNDRAESINVIDSGKRIQGSVKNGTYSQEVTRPYFLWWNQNVSYKLNNIQDCNNLPEGDDFTTFRKFVGDVQNERIKHNKNAFDWTFKVDSNVRKTYSTWTYHGWEYWYFLGNGESYSMSTCHEVKQCQVFWMHFRDKGQDFYLDVQDVPCDTSSIVIGNVPFETLTDQIADVFVDVGSSLWDILKNVGQNIIPLAFAILGIVLVIAFMPMLQAGSQTLSIALKTANNKRKKKESKKKKGK